MAAIGKQWIAQYGMHRLLDNDCGDLRENGFRSHEGTLEILLRPGATAKILDEAIRSASGRRDRAYWLVRGTNLGVGMLIGGGTLVVLALIDLFNQLVGTTVIDRVLGTPWQGSLMLLTFLAGGAAVSFAPRLISADDGWARGLAVRWINEEARARSRINRRLRASCQRSLVRRVVIWNALSPYSIGPHGILECFRGVEVDVELHIHHDEQAQLMDFLTILRDQCPEVCFNMPSPIPNHEFTAEAGCAGESLESLGQVAGLLATQAYGLAIQHSTYRVVEPWRSAIVSSGKFPNAGIAYRLAAERYDQLFKPSDPDQQSVRGTQWMQRFVTDYRLFVPDLIAGVLRTAGNVSAVDPLSAHRELALMLEVRNPAHAPLPNDLKDDVASVFITIMRTESEDWESPEFGILLNHYVNLAAAKGHYRGINVLAEVIAQELAVPSELRRLLPQLTIESLMLLHEPLSIAGHGQLAIRIANWIAPFTGTAGALQRATILERIGDYDAARCELDSIEAFALTDAPLLDSFLRRSVWLMLSAGRQEPGWNPELARTQLEKLDELFSRPNRVRTPNEARELENFWALLLEWEDNRLAAIERHQRAIDLPGVPLRRVLGSMINKGRTQRDLAVAQIVRNPDHAGISDFKTALEALEEAVSVINRGYWGKLEIGDMDESPIGAHNLAIARLYQSAVCGRLDGRERALEFAMLALEHAQEGHEQLRISGSTRKKSTLLAEAQLAARIAGLSASDEHVSWYLIPLADRQNLDWVFILNPALNSEAS